MDRITGPLASVSANFRTSSSAGRRVSSARRKHRRSGSRSSGAKYSKIGRSAERTAVRTDRPTNKGRPSGETDSNKGNAAAQTTEAMARVERTMKAAGFSLSDAVEGMAYVVDGTKFPEVDAAYHNAFQKDFPARTGVSVGLVVPGAEGEFSFIAQK